MPITSSGEISLIADIEAEFDQTGTEDISLVQAATDAGLSTTDASMFGFYGASDVAVGSITTNSISSVGGSGMTLNGNITNDGGGTITDHGFYFGTSATYSSNTKVSLGTGSVGSYSSVRTGLSSQTTYYATAYVVNSAGESVGATVSAATVFTYQTGNLSLLRTRVNQYGTYYINPNVYKQYRNVNNNQYLNATGLSGGYSSGWVAPGSYGLFSYNHNTAIYTNTTMRVYSIFFHNTSFNGANTYAYYNFYAYRTGGNFTSKSNAPSPYTQFSQGSLSMPGGGATSQLVGTATRTVTGWANPYMGFIFTY
jgi:hypothetical protein